jgi:hypothetical protein
MFSACDNISIKVVNNTLAKDGTPSVTQSGQGGGCVITFTASNGGSG